MPTKIANTRSLFHIRRPQSTVAVKMAPKEYLCQQRSCLETQVLKIASVKQVAKFHAAMQNKNTDK